MNTTAKERYEVMERLGKLGIAYDDACKLRRIALTLRRWFELECGDSNRYGSTAIVRGEINEDGVFCYDDGGKPFLEHHRFQNGHENVSIMYSPIADKETGSRTRLAAILAKYPTLHAYIQPDPRGAALYILTDETIQRYAPQPIDSIYNHGVAVY